jgi:putative transposase
MPSRLKRLHDSGDLHFITFSCDHRRPSLASALARDVFESSLEFIRERYQFRIYGYVVMPEHIHLLASEPDGKSLCRAVQALKVSAAKRLDIGHNFWERRYYDFNVWTDSKLIEKLRYLHRNPVSRGLVAQPEDWR